MMKTRVQRTRIDIITQAQLLYPAQPLKVAVFHNIEYQLVRNGDEPIHRVVEYFAFVQKKGYLKSRAKKGNKQKETHISSTDKCQSNSSYKHRIGLKLANDS